MDSSMPTKLVAVSVLHEQKDNEFKDNKNGREEKIKSIVKNRWSEQIDLIIQNDTKIKDKDDSMGDKSDMENNVNELMERVSDKITKNKLEAAIDKTKFMFLVYMGFYTALLVACILVFGGYVNDPKIGDTEVPLILTVNIIGSCIILLWVTCQYGDNFTKCWTMKSLYTPLIAHMVDTASDLGAIYIYYHNWEIGGDDEFSKSDYFQFFMTSLSILIIYRIVSSILLYFFSRNKGMVMMQMLDLYIFEVLAKSWTKKKNKPTLIQQYVQGLEAYFESYPQLILSTYFIVNKLSNDNSTSSVIWFSAIFSLISVSERIITEDTKYFHIEVAARNLDFDRSNICCRNEKRCCFNWEYMVRVMFRYCEVILRVLGLTALWRYASGFTVVGVVFVEFILSIIIGTLSLSFSCTWTVCCFHKYMSFNMGIMSCIAVSPLPESNYISLIVLSYKWITNLLLVILSFAVYIKVGFVYLSVIVGFCYIFTFMFSLMISVPVWFKRRKKDATYWPCRWIRRYGSNSRSFGGVECLEDLQQLLEFGYMLKPRHIHRGNFDTMKDIELIYRETLQYNQDPKWKQQITEAWKNIIHPIKGSLLHQICMNNDIERENIASTLNFVIEQLGYRPSTKSLLLAYRYQDDPTMEKIFKRQYMLKSPYD